MPWVALIPKLVLTDEGGGNELAGPRRPDDPEVQQPRERFLSLRINSASMRARVQARRGCPGRQGRLKSKHAGLLNAMQSPTVRDLSQSLRPFALTSITYLGKGRVAKHPGPRGAPIHCELPQMGSVARNPTPLFMRSHSLPSECHFSGLLAYLVLPTQRHTRTSSRTPPSR